VLEGNRSKRRINEAEPQPEQRRPTCPCWLTSYAQHEWQRIIPELERLELLTIVDRLALAGYCQSYARWREAEVIIAKEGLTFTTENGYVQQRPEVAIAHKALLAMKAFCQEFGLTPASRSHISVGKKSEPDDPMEELLP